MCGRVPKKLKNHTYQESMSASPLIFQTAKKPNNNKAQDNSQSKFFTSSQRNNLTFDF